MIPPFTVDSSANDGNILMILQHAHPDHAHRLKTEAKIKDARETAKKLQKLLLTGTEDIGTVFDKFDKNSDNMRAFFFKMNYDNILVFF